MLNGRIYRAAFLPFLLALGIAAFSLGARPGPLRSNLAPDAFQGSSALARLNDLGEGVPAAAAREQQRRAHGPDGGGRHRSPRGDRRRGLRGPRLQLQRPDDRRRTDAHQRGGGAPRLDQLDPDRDRRPPGRRPRAVPRTSCRPPPRCWNSRACSPPGTPSGRSCSPPPAVAAAATPGSASCATSSPAPARRCDRARRPRGVGGWRRPMVIPYSDGQGSAPLVLAANRGGRDQGPGRDRSGRPECTRPARSPDDSPDRR